MQLLHEGDTFAKRWNTDDHMRTWTTLIDALNVLGQDGWELAAMRNKKCAILKRPIAQKPQNIAMLVPLVKSCPACGHVNGVYHMGEDYTVCARCDCLLAGTRPEVAV
jgi:hypothetical protein